MNQNLNRVCGDCKLCCKVFSIQELDKPAGKWCPHCPGKGCKIYDTRPEECRGYKCMWLAGAFPEECRPDKVYVVFGFKRLDDLIVATVGESHYGAALSTEVQSIIASFRALGYGVQIIHNGICHELIPPYYESDADVIAYFQKFFVAHGNPEMADDFISRFIGS